MCTARTSTIKRQADDTLTELVRVCDQLRVSRNFCEDDLESGYTKGVMWIVQVFLIRLERLGYKVVTLRGHEPKWASVYVRPQVRLVKLPPKKPRCNCGLVASVALIVSISLLAVALAVSLGFVCYGT